MTSKKPLKPAYTYRATVDYWVDGDTVDLTVDVGFRMTYEGRFRLHGIDTPERGRPGFNEATDYARGKAPEGSTVVVKTYKDPDMYGRWLCIIYTEDGNLNNELVSTGHAEIYRKPSRR